MTRESASANVKLFPILLVIVILCAFALAYIGDAWQTRALDANKNPPWLQTLRDSLNSKNHWERVVALRHYVHQTSDMGLPAFYMDYNAVDTMPLSKLHAVFQNDLVAVQCGGASLYLNKLYKKFGYRSWSHDVGQVYEGIRGASHQFNIVEVPLGGDTIFSAQDAHFGHTYVDRSGTPIDYFRMLRLIEERKADSIFIQNVNDTGLVDLLVCNVNLFFDEMKEEKGISRVKRFRENIEHTIVSSYHPACYEKIRYHYSLDFFMEMSGDQYLTYLQKNGYPPNFIYLFLFPKSVTGPEAEKMRARIDSIIEPKTAQSE